MGDETYKPYSQGSALLIGNYLPKGTGYSQEDFEKLVALAQDKNTYIESVDGDGLPSADTFHYHIKRHATLGYIHERFRVNVIRFLKDVSQKIILLFDETYEPYYGHNKNAYIHEYKPVRGCTGCYKFLNCHALLPDGTKQFIDSVPMQVFSRMENETGKMLRFVKASRVKILFCLFDRGYYSNMVINEIERQRVKYLMLVPKTDGIKEVLDENSKEMFVKKNYMVAGKARTDIIVIRDWRFDWTFATNLRFRELPNAIRTYKIRWNIETGFRVADEARIKSKSTNIVVRYFLFLCSILLYNVWKRGYNKMSFKRFISMLSNTVIGEKYYRKGFLDCLWLVYSGIDHRWLV